MSQAHGPAGVRVPDSQLAAEATELVRDTTSDLLYDHARRVYFFGSLLGRARGIDCDPELLYVAALFHDVGLGEGFRDSGRRFEVDGAEEARRFLEARQVARDRVRRVWTAVALHTTPDVPEFMEPEVALLAAGVDYDVLGSAYDEIAAADRDAVVAAHPRPAFKQGILRALADGVEPRPQTTFGTAQADVLAHYDPHFRRGDFVRMVLDSPWPE
ncbi:HD domain-containing protein [Streptomyces spirodelae]|uniref:HD domain-containing protein n=1 Tax=Streptomyces spirodelae TaxID=2812904 RepID=A0ABS3WM72_9ACTN|nr:HD domain-containing protein [Streptomyces spirodelae]MBO8184212.1 HD domain-containing protein [Streptomyces spirodelae]